MKKTIILAGLLALAKITNSQNSFPANGFAGAGNPSPSTDLQIGDGVGSLHYGGRGLLIKFAPGTGAGDRALLEMHDPTGANRLIIQSLANGSYLGSKDGKPLFIQTDGGNVGINTGNPLYLLDVNGTANVANNLFVGVKAGIGTTSPAAALSVHSTEAQTILGKNVSSAIRITNNYTSAFGRRSELQFGLDQSSNTTLATIATEYTAWTGGNVGGDLIFGTASDQVAGISERMRINNKGNIGIGTTAPEDKLQVNSGSNKVVAGSAYGSGLNYGTGYLGFNASRDNSVLQQNSNWKIATDGANNGGGVIFGDVYGNMYFSTITKSASSANADQYINDASVKNRLNMKLKSNGSVQIGLETTTGTHADALLSVFGKVVSRSLYVTQLGWADFVFDKNYKLPTLTEIETYYKANGHLPLIPTAAEVSEKGIDVGEMNKLLLQKVEELTILMVQQDKRIKELENKK